MNYHYFQEVQHQTQQQISRGVKESHCDSFYNNNIRYLYFSDLIISASSSFFPSILLAVWFSTQGHRKSVPERYVRAAIVATKRYHTASIIHLQQPSPAVFVLSYMDNDDEILLSFLLLGLRVVKQQCTMSQLFLEG